MALIDSLVAPPKGEKEGSATAEMGGKPEPAAGLTVAGAGPDKQDAFKSLEEAVNKIDNNEMLKRALLTIIGTAKGDIDKVRQGVEEWYNSTMDRVAGWYKKRVQTIVFLMGFAAAIILNADTIAIFTSLCNDRPLRSAIVDAAKNYKGSASASEVENKRIKENVKELGGLGLPVGWGWASDCNPNGVSNPKAIPEFDGDKLAGSIGNWLSKLFGWFITGMAVSLGAPFWFDILNKIMVVRSTVKPHEKSQEEASQDRQ